MEILNKQISPEAKALVEIKEGKLQLSAVLDTGGVDANVAVAVEVDYFIDELAKKIPGQIDDAIFAVLKTALKDL
jgi:hypothetical protein